MTPPLFIVIVMAIVLAIHAAIGHASPSLQSVVVTVSSNDSGVSSTATLSVSDSTEQRTWIASEEHSLSVQLVPHPHQNSPLAVSVFLSPSLAPNSHQSAPTGLPFARTGNIMRVRLNDACLPQGSYSLSMTAASSADDAVVVPLGKLKWSPVQSQCIRGHQDDIIQHQFQNDDHPSKIILSSIFMLLVTLPGWMLVVPMWSLIASSMPARVTLLNTLFVLGVLSFLGLAITYWTVLNLLETLPIAIIVSAIFTPLAIHALQEHHLW